MQCINACLSSDYNYGGITLYDFIYDDTIIDHYYDCYCFDEEYKPSDVSQDSELLKNDDSYYYYGRRSKNSIFLIILHYKESHS